MFFLGSQKNYLYICQEFIKKTETKCLITVFILATLTISSLGSKDCLWLFERLRNK